MLLLPRRIFPTCRASTLEPLLEEDYQKLSSPTASFTSMFEPEEEPLPSPKTSELTELLLRTSVDLDHNDKVRHDEEVADEMHVVLFRALHEATTESYDSHDVLLALDCLEKLLCCADQVAREIFMGGCGVPLLQLVFLLAEMNYRLGNPHVVSSCKSIIGRFVSLEMDLTSMYRSSEFLSFLVIAIEGTSGNEAVLCASLSLESLSRQPVNKPILIDRRDVLDCLFGMVDGNLPGSVKMAAMRSIVNLASDCAPAVEIYANNQIYVGILVKATSDDEVDIRAAAVEILLLMSTSSDEIRASLLQVSDDDILDRLLLVAEDFTDSNHTRVCALHAFGSLIKSGKAAAKITANSIRRLRNVACGNSDLIATQAAIAIKTMSAELALYDDPLLPSALDAIVEMATSSCLQVKMWSARIIREQTLDPAKHRMVLGADGILPALLHLIQNSHPSVCRPALESMHSLVRNDLGAVAIANDECLLSKLVDVVSNSNSVQADDKSGRQMAMEVLINLVMNSSALDLIVSKRDTFVDILMELSLFGCGKVGEKALRAEAMEAVAQLANYL